VPHRHSGSGAAAAAAAAAPPWTSLPHNRSELLPKQIKIGEESGEAIASSIMKNIGQGPIVSLREPSFKLSHQPQAQPKTDKKPNDQVLTVNIKKVSAFFSNCL
jgi:hypothetical protein